MNFVTTPGGLIGTRKAQITLKTEERDIRLELGCEGKIRRQNQTVGVKSGFP
jgi:hypothetical protein